MVGLTGALAVAAFSMYQRVRVAATVQQDVALVRGVVAKVRKFSRGNYAILTSLSYEERLRLGIIPAVLDIPSHELYLRSGAIEGGVGAPFAIQTGLDENGSPCGPQCATFSLSIAKLDEDHCARLIAALNLTTLPSKIMINGQRALDQVGGPLDVPLVTSQCLADEGGSVVLFYR